MSGPTGPWSAPGGMAPSPAAPAGGQDPQPAGQSPFGRQPAGPGGPGGASGPLQRELVRRPGLFPLRPLGVGEVFGAALGIYRRRPKLVFGVSTIVFGIAFVIISIASGLGMAPTVVQMQSVMQDPEGAGVVGGSVGELLGTLSASLVTGLITLVALQLVLVMLTRLTMVETTGVDASDADLRSVLRTHGWKAVVAALIIDVLCFVPFLVISLLGGLPLLIVREAHWWTIAPLPLFLVVGLLAALWMWTRTAFTTPALVIEDAGILGAIRRSFALTRGRRLWRALGVLLLVTISYVLIQQVISGVFGTVGGIAYAVVLLATQASAVVPAMILLLAITMIGSFAANVLIAPFLAAGLTALYADLRMRHESWDIALRRAQHEAGGGDAAGGAR